MQPTWWIGQIISISFEVKPNYICFPREITLASLTFEAKIIPRPFVISTFQNKQNLGHYLWDPHCWPKGIIFMDKNTSLSLAMTKFRIRDLSRKFCLDGTLIWGEFLSRRTSIQSGANFEDRAILPCLAPRCSETKNYIFYSIKLIHVHI